MKTTIGMLCEERSRAAKVDALVEVLLSHGYTADLMLVADADDWALAAQGAGVKPPSLTTQHLVITEMSRIERLTAGRVS